jgi:hypothetical protein
VKRASLHAHHNNQHALTKYSSTHDTVVANDHIVMSVEESLPLSPWRKASTYTGPGVVQNWYVR